MKPSDKVILVVEDHAANMKLCHDLLMLHSYHVLQAKNGIQGWELTREHRPDLILMDIHLPDVSGLEVAKWMKNDEDLRSIPIIAITAFAMKGDEEKFLKNGCDGYVSKPVSMLNLLNTIDRFTTEVDSVPTMTDLYTARSTK